MFDFLNCCSYGAKLKEPKAQIIYLGNVSSIQTKERLLYSSLPTSEKFDPAGFVLEWLPKSIKDIQEEIKNFEKLQAKKNENFLLFKQQKELLKDVQTFILGEAQDGYKLATIRLELVTAKPASELKSISKTPILQEYNFR